MDFRRTSIPWFPVSLLAIASLPGCAAAQEEAPIVDGADQEVTGGAVLEAKLYADPRVRPASTCDAYTHLEVVRTRGGKLKALLENRLAETSLCEIMIAPNPRSFTVTQSGSCGSTTYESAGAAPKIAISDHRRRVCEDIRPSLIEVQETTADGKTQQLYGEPL